MSLYNEHAIAVAVEPILLFNGFSVRFHDQVSICKGTDEDKETATRQMKVGEQHIDGLELMTWANEDVGLSSPWNERNAARQGRSLERPGRCGANGHDASPFGTATRQSLYNRFGDLSVLAVHFVIG